MSFNIPSPSQNAMWRRSFKIHNGDLGDQESALTGKVRTFASIPNSIPNLVIPEVGDLKI